MNFTQLIRKTILLVTFAAMLSAAVCAQKQAAAGDKVLVTGRYALKQSDFDTLTDFYEWLLDAEFSPAQRRRFQTLMVRESQSRESTAKAVAEIAEGFKKIRAAAENRREEARRQLLPDIIAALEGEDSEVNQMLLGIYRDAQNNDGDDSAVDDSRNENAPLRTGGAVKVADLAGIWSTSSVSGERYKSLVTGQLSDPSGSIIEYQISPNGAIKHVGYLSMTTYSCTTKLFISRTGRISINGSRITFDFAPGKRMYQTCSASASRNDTLPAERKTYPFRLERDANGLKLCTVEENGKEFCIGKKGD